MAIRWDELPHDEIRLKVYAQLKQNSIARSADDALRHMVSRQLHRLRPGEHRRFVELEASEMVHHLRCTRDVYREVIAGYKCRPILEAHWVILRLAVFPTALRVLQEKAVNYAKSSRVPGRDLSILFGIYTRTCSKPVDRDISLIGPPELDDDTPATNDELEALGKLVKEDTLLWFRDIRDGGGVGRPFGGGPFSADDLIAARRSWSLCGVKSGITFVDWIGIRKRFWDSAQPWSEGLNNLFGSVQEELIAQWRALPVEARLSELELEQAAHSITEVVVPPPQRLPLRLQRGKECEELAQEIKTIHHKSKYGALTTDEIRRECPSLEIWKRVEVLSFEDKETFLHPGTWEPGYENLLLGKIYAVHKRVFAAQTVNTWRKEYRDYQRWQTKNPSRAAEDFEAELQERKRKYRTSDL